ncbi:translation elongation factor Ts [Mycoplasmoides alvi]|uniref:translation elongation factor Ts n=1 Tax=Mycoplasmoides alvi TaxID=78580 RepID=UPI00051B06FC|nr:translation elongation factor Ts [Mycoplasmoides alvi]
MASQTDLIKQLRVMTQAGFMDCKKALDNTNNDLDLAVKWLRENGIAKAAKKVDSVAAEGIIAIHANDEKALMVEINSQTDFVSKNELFLEYVNNLTDSLFATSSSDVKEAKSLKLKTGKTIDETQVELTATIGEKISLRRIENISVNSTNESIGTYLHANKRIGVIIVTSKSENNDVIKHLAMHIAANNPKFINKDNVDSIWLQSEKELIETQVQADDAVKEKINKAPENKKHDLLKTIIEGRVNKLLVESCLESQPYLIDSSKKVGEILKELNLSVKKFVRFEVGEGIDKKISNFAEEVQSQMK